MDCYSLLNYELISELNYLMMVINESLRCDPPIEISAMHTVTEDI